MTQAKSMASVQLQRQNRQMHALTQHKRTTHGGTCHAGNYFVTARRNLLRHDSKEKLQRAAHKAV